MFHSVSYTNGNLIIKAFRHFRKIAKSGHQLCQISPSFRPSVRMEHLCPNWTDFHEWYFWIIQKYVRKIKIRLKSDKKSGTSHADLCTFIRIYRSILLRMRNVLENFVERIKTHFIFKNYFLKIIPFMKQCEKNSRTRQTTVAIYEQYGAACECSLFIHSADTGHRTSDSKTYFF